MVIIETSFNNSYLMICSYSIKEIYVIEPKGDSELSKYVALILQTGKGSKSPGIIKHNRKRAVILMDFVIWISTKF